MIINTIQEVVITAVVPDCKEQDVLPDEKRFIVLKRGNVLNIEFSVFNLTITATEYTITLRVVDSTSAEEPSSWL